MIQTGSSRRGGSIFEAEVKYAPLDVVLNAVKSSVSPIMLRTWMVSKVHPWLVNQIVDIFAYEGRGLTGPNSWAPLSPATLSIRKRMGNHSDAINMVEGNLLDFLISNREITQVGGWSQISVPGKEGDAVTQHKLRTAQFGQPSAKFFGDDDVDVSIPARPVLVLEESDRVVVMQLLQEHIMTHVSTGLSFGNIGSL